MVYLNRRFNLIMQFRRDRSLYIFLIVICFIIVLLYQHHYASNYISRTINYDSIRRTNEKFRSLSNEYSAVKEKCLFFVFD